MITLKSTEYLAKFTAKQVKISGLSRETLSKKTGKSKALISHAVSFGERSNSGRNSVRMAILKALGFEVETVFQIKKL